MRLIDESSSPIVRLVQLVISEGVRDSPPGLGIFMSSPSRTGSGFATARMAC